ncbi:hypothetical protein EFL76_10045 [Weissella confusa]|nr:hypothetical protein [Weissella confusa]
MVYFGRPSFFAVDVHQTSRVFLGCCAWPRHAYRHVQTLTRRCGFLAGFPLRATGGKGKRSLLWFALLAGHGQYVLACLRRGQALRPEVGHTPQIPRQINKISLIKIKLEKSVDFYN